MCEASARPGSSARRFSMICVYGTEAPSRTLSSPTSHSGSSPMRFRSRRYSGRRWSKLISTITSVPPAMGTAVGCSALAASASSQLAGRRKSMSGSLLLKSGSFARVPVTAGPRHLSRSCAVNAVWPQYTSRAAPGAVTETMKELAGLHPRLVDSYERRCSVTSPLSNGNIKTDRRRHAMRLRALLETDALGLRLLGGEDELDRTVRGVMTTDLRDPSRYLSGGELVLTGSRLAPRRRRLRAVRTASWRGRGRGRASRPARRSSERIPDDLVAACVSAPAAAASRWTSRSRSRRSPSTSYGRSPASAPATWRRSWTGTAG